MTVTIVTPSYNSESTIAKTLNSVAGQAYPDIEHVVIDGGSEDDTLKIVQSFSHVNQCLSERDEGIYDAMNKGINLAKGDIIGILNSDDFYPSADIISKVISCFEDPSIQLVYGDLRYVDSTGSVVRKWKAGPMKNHSFRRGWMPPHPTVFVKASVYKRLGNYRLDMGTSADYEWLLRVLYKNKIPAAYCPDTLVHMTTGGASNASLSNRWRANKMDRQAWAVNDLAMPWYTPIFKPLSKVTQWL